MIPNWEEEMTDPSKWSKIHDLQDERARNFLLARRVKTADGTLILPTHLQQLADEIIEKDRQISQGLWVPGPGVDTLIAVLGPEHGGRTRGVGHTVGLKQSIPGILEKKRKSRPLMETDLEEQRMAFNAECEEKRRLLDVECEEKRRLFDAECEEKRRSLDAYMVESRKRINDEFEGKRRLFDAHFQMCMQQMSKHDDIHVGGAGIKKSSNGSVHSFAELDGAKASNTSVISKPVITLPSTQLLPTKSSQQGTRKKTIPKKLHVRATSAISEQYLNQRPKELQALYRRWESRPDPKQGINVHVAPGVFGAQSFDFTIFRDDIHFLVKNAWLDHSIIAWYQMFLQKNMQTKANNKCGFIYPASIYGDLCQRNADLVISNIVSAISYNRDLCFFLAPYLQSNHWSLLLICPRLRIIYILDSLRSEGKTVDTYIIKELVEAAVMRYHEEGGPCETDKSRPFRWEFSNCNQQESGWECGYYVMYFMFHFASYQQSSFPKRVLWNDPTPLTKRMLDDIAKTWAGRFSSVYLKHLVG